MDTAYNDNSEQSTCNCRAVNCVIYTYVHTQTHKAKQRQNMQCFPLVDANHLNLPCLLVSEKKVVLIKDGWGEGGLWSGFFSSCSLHGPTSYFDASVMHHTWIWTTGSLTWVGDHFACTYTEGALVSVSRKRHLQHLQEFESGERHKAWHVTL